MMVILNKKVIFYEVKTVTTDKVYIFNIFTISLCNKEKNNKLVVSFGDVRSFAGKKP